MKKIFVILLAVFSLQAAENKDPITVELKATADIVQAGKKLEFKAEWTCPENYQLCAWRPVVFVGNAPKDFAESTGMKVKENLKDPKWNFIEITPYKWYPKDKRPRETAVLNVDTTDKWPVGDYKMNITLLFRDKNTPDQKTDKYIGKEIVFSIEK